MTLITLLLLNATGCTYNQSKSLGMNKSAVNKYPQKMSNIELCDTLYYRRSTNQTKIAITAEFNRRGLSRSWCENEMGLFYLYNK